MKYDGIASITISTVPLIFMTICVWNGAGFAEIKNVDPRTNPDLANFSTQQWLVYVIWSISAMMIGRKHIKLGRAKGLFGFAAICIGATAFICDIDWQALKTFCAPNVDFSFVDFLGQEWRIFLSLSVVLGYLALVKSLQARQVAPKPQFPFQL